MARREVPRSRKGDARVLLPLRVNYTRQDQAVA